MKDIRLLINNIEADVMLEDELDFRIQRVIQNEDDFLDKGGDFTFQISLPVTPNNDRIFGGLTTLSQYRKFNFKVPYACQLYVRGVIVLNGSFLLTSVTNRRYQGEMSGDNSEWLERLEDIKLCEIGYVDNEPTWFQEYLGITSANLWNNRMNRESDLVFPMIQYNNTPITDYKDFNKVDIVGSTDGGGNVITNPKSFPSDFEVRPGYFGTRVGLTFEDFPPALYYRNVIEKIFEDIDYSVSSELFAFDWFNRLIIPFTGEQVQWNWKSLAKLYLDSPVGNYQFGVPGENIIFEDYNTDGPRIVRLAEVNCMQFDVPNNRIDRIANYKKWKVNDKSNFSYICPVTGRYKVDVKLDIFKQVTTTTAANIAFGTIGGPNAGIDPNTPYNWSDSVLVIVRQNESGEYDLNPNWKEDLAKWIDNKSNNFINNPSDVIAYFSPLRNFHSNIINPLNPIEVSGSPLTDNQESVTITQGAHSYNPNPLGPNNTNWLSSSEVDISIELDLQKNERIAIFWFTPLDARPTTGVFSTISAEFTTNNQVSAEINIDYVCGYEDLDLAALLPCSSAKDFIADFIAQFNLDFKFTEGRNIEFVVRDQFIRNRANNIDITEFLHYDTIEFTPARVPVNYIVGYDNDEDDRLLTQAASGCTEDSRSVTEYANVQFSGSDNIYSRGTKEIRNFFSATRFTPATVEAVPYPLVAAPTETAINIANPPNINLFVTGYDFGPTTTKVIQIPNIQSEDSFRTTTFGDLNYSFNYKPRILKYRGFIETVDMIFKRIFVNAPGIEAADKPDHWYRPTVCSFHTDNGDIVGPLRTLRYDTLDGLYNTYFNDTIDSRGDAYILKADISITPYLWTQLDGSKFVTYQDDLYQILKIEDYDPINNNPAIITLLKLV